MRKAFIFDMDGVIIDSEPLHFESDIMTLKEYNIDILVEELSKFVGISNPDMWMELKEKYQLSDTIDEILVKQSKYKELVFNSGQLSAINGISKLLYVLKEKSFIIGLASSSPRTFIELVLDKLDIRDYFNVIVSSEEVIRGKPAPDIFLEAAKQLGVMAKDCTVIEDSEHGVLAAKLSGMKCIGYQNKNSGNQDLSKADYIVNNIEEIITRSLYE